MAKRGRRKIGRVLLGKFDGSDKWEVRYGDPETGKYVRRRLDVTNLADAKAVAEEINVELVTARGDGAVRRRSRTKRFTVKEAVLSAVRASKGSEETKAAYIDAYNQFARWIDGRPGRPRFWDEVDGQILIEYEQHCYDERLKHATRVHRLGVLRLASRHMAFAHGTRDVTIGMRIAHRAAEGGSRNQPIAILAPAVLRDLLARLRETDPLLHAWCALSGIAGLRMLEGIYLTRGCVDLDAGTIKVATSSLHIPKTPWSFRTIPVCGYVVEALRDWIDANEPVGDEGFLFGAPPPRGRTPTNPAALAGCYSRHSAWARYKRRFKRFAKADPPLVIPPRFTPKKLRNSFVSAVCDLDANGDTVTAYLGQKPTSVRATHYDEPSMERLATVAALAQELATAEK